MPREISDDEWNYYQGRKQVADFVESIYNDPAFNKEAKALIKKKYPNVQIPDYDIRTEMEQRFDAEKKAREDAEAATRKAKEDEDWKRTRAETQKEFGFTDDGMKELEDFMVKNEVGSYKVAAKYLASEKPKPSDTDFDTGLWQHSKQEGFAEIAKDPEGWARGEIIRAIRNDEQRARGGR